MSEFKSYIKGYLMGADGMYYKVSDEVFDEYMRLWWKEEYQKRRDRTIVSNKKGNSSLDGKAFPRVVSFDSITDANGDHFLSKNGSLEDEVIRKEDEVIRKKVYACLHRAMEELSPEETHLLTKVYIEDMSISRYAEECQEPRTTVQYRHKKILSKLRDALEKDAEFSRDMLREAFEPEER